MAHPANATFWVRVDSGNDSTDNVAVCWAIHAEFLIKRNLSRESLGEWLAVARAEGTAEHLRERKTLYRAVEANLFWHWFESISCHHSFHFLGAYYVIQEELSDSTLLPL